MGRFVVMLLAFQGYVLGYLFVGLALSTGFAKNFRVVEPGIPTVTWRAWWARRWVYSTTVGRGMCMHPHHDILTTKLSKLIYEHEMVHVRQGEDQGAVATLIAVLLLSYEHVLAALLVWLLLPPATMLLNMGMAGLRYGWAHAYRESEHERAAYSQTS